MTTSERAMGKMGIKDIPNRDKPLSERFRLTGKEWVQANKVASSMEEGKTSALAKKKTELMNKQGEMSEAKAERIVKSSNDWAEYLQAMVNLRAIADDLKIELDALQIEKSEQINESANSRAERNRGLCRREIQVRTFWLTKERKARSRRVVF